MWARAQVAAEELFLEQIQALRTDATMTPPPRGEEKMPSCGVDVPCPTNEVPFPPAPPAPADETHRPSAAELQATATATLCESVRAAVADAELLPDCGTWAGGKVLPVDLGGLAAVLAEAKDAKAYNLALFYGERCPFSRVLAPTFEALAAAFPNLYAFKVEGSDGGRLNSRLGIRSFPTLVLLKGDSVHRMLYQRRLPELVSKITNATGLAAVGSEEAGVTAYISLSGRFRGTFSRTKKGRNLGDLG